jgi:hypothetical protein
MIYATNSPFYKKFLKKEVQVKSAIRESSGLLDDLVDLVVGYKTEFEHFEIVYPQMCETLYGQMYAAAGLYEMLPRVMGGDGVPAQTAVPILGSIKTVQEMCGELLTNLIHWEGFENGIRATEMTVTDAFNAINTTMGTHPDLEMVVREVRNGFPFPGVHALKNDPTYSTNLGD